MKLNDRIYDVLKWVVIIVLPAVAALYTALAPSGVGPGPEAWC